MNILEGRVNIYYGKSTINKLDSPKHDGLLLSSLLLTGESSDPII